MKKRILLIPDAFFNNQSGALVAHHITNLYIENGDIMAVFFENAHKYRDENIVLFDRIPYKASANWIEKEYKDEFQKVLDAFKPDLVFFLGVIINKNICYIDLCLKSNIKVAVMLFIQDFFCNRLYANLEDGPCTRCLEGTYLHALRNQCGVSGIVDVIKLQNAALIRNRLRKLLPKVNYVIGSSKEQVDFYSRYGISDLKILQCPLFFDENRLSSLSVKMGDYFVCSGQNRLEKGIHLLQYILPFCPNVKVKIVFSNQTDANISLEKNGLKAFVETGQLEVLGNVSWDTGLSMIYAESRGIINPTIWPTTTEYALLEALGLKKTVITFDVGIHKEEIINGVNGFRAPLGDFKQFAQYIKDISNSDELYDKIGQGAYLLYQKLVNKDTFMDCLIKVLN